MQDSSFANHYTAAFDVMDCPAGVVPITKESEDDQIAFLESGLPPEGASKGIFGQPDLVYIRLLESLEGAVGLPHGVQVIGRPYEEEKVIAVMKLIENYRDNGH